MANKMRRMLALMLAMSLLAGQLVLPAGASEALLPEGAVTTQTPVENGTQITVSYTDPETGANVTGTTTVITDPETGAVTIDSEETTSMSETSTLVGSTTKTDTESHTGWNNTTETPIPGTDTPDENGFTSNGGTETTVIEGTESTEGYLIQDGPNFPIEEYEKTEGEETTTVTTTEIKEKEENIYHNEHTTDNGYQKDEKESSNGSYKEVAGTGGKDTTEDAVITQKPGNVELNMTPGKSDSETILLNVDQLMKDNIDLPKEGKSSSTAPDGTITETVVTYIRKDGQVIGYTTTKTVISSEIVKDDADYTRGQTSTGTDTQVDYTTGDSTDITYLMPAKPQESTVKNPDGSTTVTTVEEITQDVLDSDGNVVLDENGSPVTELIGYRTNTVTTSADGQETITGCEEIYRTVITTDIDTTTTDVTTTDTTGLTKERVTLTTYARFYDAEGQELVIKDGQWVYKATMSNVKAEGQHGKIDIKPLTPTSMVLNGKEDVVNRADSYITPTTDPTGDSGFPYLYTGVRGEGSVFQVKTSQYSDSDAHMFQMKVGNQTFYVYCVDFAVTAVPKFDYDIENVADATYYGAEESRHLQAIGMNGYWGVTDSSKTGSLKNMVDAMLEAKKAGHSALKDITAAQIKAMSEGEALTATQAAFWKYGNSGSVTMDNTQANKTITAAYNWLISLEADVNDTTDIIDKNEFATSASVTVKDKVYENGEEKTDSKGRNYYNTDVSFTIDVAKSSLTGNLVISLKQNGKTVESINLETADSNLLGKVLSDGKAGSTNVTFKNVELVEGVNFTIDLEGTQNLKEGVYIYTSEKAYSPDKGVVTPSQTFIGLAEGTQKVDLSVNMSFTVSEPDVEVKDPGAKPTQVKQDILVEKKLDTETITNTVRTTEVETTVTQKTNRNWLKERLRQWSYEYDPELYDDDGDDGTNIPDEEVPLADAPRTGDISGLWAALSGLSLGGVLLLGRKRKDEDA